MTIVFVDTAYWVARIDPRDQWHSMAKEVTKTLTAARFLTTELVLAELLNYFSGYRAEVRQEVANTVQNFLTSLDIEIVWQTQALFLSGLGLYEARLDKGYSLTDCISMVIMTRQGIQQVLTHDKHFVQEGFSILLG
jgi:uncharacterized protein